MAVVSLSSHLRSLRQSQHQTVESLIGSLLGMGPRLKYSVTLRDPWQYLALDPDAGWQPVRDPDRSANAVAQAIAANPRTVVKTEYEASDAAEGWFDPPSRTEARALRFTRADGAPMPAADIPALIRALAESDGAWMVDPSDDLSPWELSSGRADQRRTSILWRAVANNAAALAGVVGLVLSLGWVPRRLTHRRRERRVAAGRCPRCGYDRRATAPGAPCPECGSPFSVE